MTCIRTTHIGPGGGDGRHHGTVVLSAGHRELWIRDSDPINPRTPWNVHDAADLESQSPKQNILFTGTRDQCLDYATRELS